MLFVEYLSKSYRKKLLNTGIDASKILFHEAAEETIGEFFKKWLTVAKWLCDTVANSYDNKIVKPYENSRNTEEIIIPTEKTEKMWNELR